jgi:AcrR family transcriptional regulator
MKPSGSTKAARPLRRDAAANRDRLLAAASEVFDAQGLDARVADIAHVAGVGMWTLYRRFPTKDALIDALVHDTLDSTIRMATDAVEAPLARDRP